MTPWSHAHPQVQEPLRKCRTLHGELAALRGVMAGTLSTPAFNASAAGQLDDAARRLERRERRVVALLESCAAEVSLSCNPCWPCRLILTLPLLSNSQATGASSYRWSR